MLGVPEARRRLAEQQSVRQQRPGAACATGGPARRQPAQQQPGSADVAAEAARHGRRSGGPARLARQWPGAAITPARPVRRGIQQWRSYTIHTTRDGSSGGGPETELRRIRRTGVYALMDERILRSRVTRL